MAGRREGRRDGCSEGELEVNGTFSQAASFKSTVTCVSQPMAWSRANRAECSHKIRLSLGTLQVPGLIWVLGTK